MEGRHEWHGKALVDMADKDPKMVVLRQRLRLHPDNRLQGRTQPAGEAECRPRRLPTGRAGGSANSGNSADTDK